MSALTKITARAKQLRRKHPKLARNTGLASSDPQSLPNQNTGRQDPVQKNMIRCAQPGHQARGSLQVALR